MPDDTPNLPVQKFADTLEEYSDQFAAALPEHIPLERFKRVVVTAANQNPDLARADRRSLFNACVKAATDGLYPDGREAALVVYPTKFERLNAKTGKPEEFYVDLVQYMPMVAGIRKRMRNTGEVLSAEAEIVCQKDDFDYELGDSPFIKHKPPPLGQDRGPMIGAYSVIRLANGEVLREVMSGSQIDNIMKAFAKGYERSRSPWKTSQDEMWRKTVLRRNAKGAPTGSDLDRLLNRDDEPLDEITADTPMRAIPPRPQREAVETVDEGKTAAEVIHELHPKPHPEIWGIDSEHNEIPFETIEQAAEWLLAQIAQAKDDRALDQVRDDNQDLIDAHFVGRRKGRINQALAARRSELAPVQRDDPKRAEGVDPESKPVEDNMEANDTAGSSSEPDARLATGGRSRAGARGEEDGQTGARAPEAGARPAPHTPSGGSAPGRPPAATVTGQGTSPPANPTAAAGGDFQPRTIEVPWRSGQPDLRTWMLLFHNAAKQCDREGLKDLTRLNKMEITAFRGTYPEGNEYRKQFEAMLETHRKRVSAE